MPRNVAHGGVSATRRVREMILASGARGRRRAGTIAPGMIPGVLPLAPVALALFAALAPVQSDDTAKYFAERSEVWLDYAERHLELSMWCRDRGLVREAKSELSLAEALSDGRHAGVS